MSGRKLGGGRILGSGKGLAPPTSPSVPRSASPLPPSESTASMGSISMSPPASASLPELGQDIGASISVGSQRKNNATDATGLVCPICNEEMVTLLQLNRHIDDSHQELPEAAQDEVKTWFDKQVLKAKRFQPLSLINQKLRGLEVFESNESHPTSAPATAAGKASLETPIDPEDLITRNHWQRPTSHDLCTDPACGKRLGPMNGNINCRHCGRLFCEEHTMYQMKLSRSANHEPVRGYWARVCETCYKSREGYNDHNGVLVDHMKTFAEIRMKKVERQKLEVSRLEKRLSKLTRILANPPEKLPSHNGSLLSPVSTLTGQKNNRKLIEQSLVTWEDDEKVSKCPFCQQEFGSWTFRRHHCRICGRVVCADSQTGCSSEVGLNVAPAPPRNGTEKPEANGENSLALNIRMCRECNHTIFSGRDFTESLLRKPPDQKAYETLRQFERGIRQLLPSFHRALQALQTPTLPNGEMDLSVPPPSHAQIQEAGKIRRRLIDSFGKYGMAAKRLRDLKTDSPTQQMLQQAVYSYTNNFLHTNMLPLKSLPQVLRHRSTPSQSSRFLATPSQSTSSLRHSELASDAGSQAASESSTVVSQLETEEKDLKERLAILEEQKFMVEEMIRSASGARRFEEVGALSRNVDELDQEIQQLKIRVGDVEQKWEGVYRNGVA
ncbi:hypothetical protein H634G_00028 [Metarhizium anisopliae BRIP 53293]|uniref:FYVE-type domain-containing protein n=1 Tax=Metarhizium anisopliae BRIP 53293 TaxID=1291518 RepID=A0A0D9PDY6_METAN|nr:hypothetical protein H634G_00028 [Metarhizium anisopliae BRIP 53293]